MFPSQCGLCVCIYCMFCKGKSEQNTLFSAVDGGFVSSFPVTVEALYICNLYTLCIVYFDHSQSSPTSTCQLLPLLSCPQVFSTFLSESQAAVSGPYVPLGARAIFLPSHWVQLSIFSQMACTLHRLDSCLHRENDASDLILASTGQGGHYYCLLYTSPSPRDAHESRMPSSA